MDKPKKLNLKDYEEYKTIGAGLLLSNLFYFFHFYFIFIFVTKNV